MTGIYAGRAIALAGLLLALQAQPQSVSSKSSFRILFGLGDTKATRWDGTIRVSSGRITKIDGWRFAQDDRAEGNASWRVATHERNGSAPPLENGIVTTATDVAADTEFQVETVNGRFSFTPSQLPFGNTLRALGGRVEIERVAVVSALTHDAEEQDFPAVAQTDTEVLLAYIQFHHSDRSLEDMSRLDAEPKSFDYLARPAGGDQVRLMRYSKARRSWSEPVEVSPPHEDCMRAAVAVDGRGRVWVVWSANRGGNFDLYARYEENGSWSPEMRLTRDPGTDINPVAATDSTGRVWVAWQAFRKDNLEIMAMAQSRNSFSPAQPVSFSPASDWDPSIAAGPKGEIAVAWDTYDKGDYDVYVRRMRFGKGVEMDRPLPVAATRKFEARSSVAYDGNGRLWVAYEEAAEKWGKDFGEYDKSGVSLYREHSIRVKCFEGAQPMEPAAAPPGAGVKSRNSFPQLTTDNKGRIYVTFRSYTGERWLWRQFMTWYDGAKWIGPVPVPQTDGTLDLRPALASVGNAELMMVAIGDHRQSIYRSAANQEDADTQSPFNSDLFMASVALDTKPEPIRLKQLAEQRVSPMDEERTPELEAIDRMRRYRTRIDGQELQLIRGEFHRHTEFSGDGGDDGPLIDAYRYLIDAAAMDWGGCCDHDTKGGGREYYWWLIQKLTDAYNLGTRYISMFSYERSVRYPEGHRNVVFPRRGIRPLPRLPKMDADSKPSPAPDTQMLYRYLRKFGGIVASHTSTTDMGTDWRDNDPNLEPVVEIYQGDRQNYEMPGAPRSPTPDHAVGGWRPLGFVSLALQKGYRLGFEASSDHVSTHISYCNLWVTSRTREAIMEAFRKRRVYGATDNILADVRCGTHFMGEEFTVNATPVFTVKLTGTDRFAKVEIVRGDRILYSFTPHERQVAFEWKDASAQRGTLNYYYIRGEQADGELVWVSPMWLHYE